VLISPYPDQEGLKIQRQMILMFIYPIYNHIWRNISTIYICNKTGIKRNILTIKQNISGSRSSKEFFSTFVRYLHFIHWTVFDDLFADGTDSLSRNVGNGVLS